MPKVFQKHSSPQPEVKYSETLVTPVSEPKAPSSGSEHSQYSSSEENEHSLRSSSSPTENEPIRTLLEWDAPARPYKKPHSSYYRTIAIIVILVILVALFMREFILIGVILSFCFVIYVLGFVPPEDVKYKISTQGITIGEHFYFWSDLESFWFTKKGDSTLLNVLTHLRFPAQLIIMLGSLEENQVKDTLGKYLPYHEIAPQSFIDKWGERLQRYFPLESPRS